MLSRECVQILNTTILSFFPDNTLVSTYKAIYCHLVVTEEYNSLQDRSMTIRTRISHDNQRNFTQKVKFNKRQIYPTSPVVRLYLPYMEIDATRIKTITRLLRTKQRKDEGSPLKTFTRDPSAMVNSPTPRRLMTSWSKRRMSLKGPVRLLQTTRSSLQGYKRSMHFTLRALPLSFPQGLLGAETSTVDHA